MAFNVLKIYVLITHNHQNYFQDFYQHYQLQKKHYIMLLSCWFPCQTSAQIQSIDWWPCWPSL